MEDIDAAETRPSNEQIECTGNQPINTTYGPPASEVSDCDVGKNGKEYPAEPTMKACTPKYILEMDDL
ncbi:hypothetical protein GCM10022229_22370 [Luteimonas lutimaris]|uniref:Uncharacterized protein n=1 Tax=Luteimonas lutimaris TaxID=698645 RepID=A0ABP7MU57_9GAMM